MPMKNYNARDAADFATIEVIQGAQIVTFREPYGAEPSLMMGERLAVVEGSGPVSDRGGAISYQSADASICTVNSATGEITPVAVGECVVQVIAAAVLPNYSITRLIDIATISVEEGVLPLDWNPQRWGRVGTNLDLTAVEDGGLSGVTVTYSVSDTGDTGCTLSGTRTLAFTGTGVCIVTATVGKTHYRDWSRDHAIRVRPAAITVTPGEFTVGETLQVGDSSPKNPAAYSGLSPSDATASWQLVRGEWDCELVSSTTGAVRARAVSFKGGTPKCSVQVVAGKANHETFKSEAVSIPLALGEIGDVPIRYGTGVSDFLAVEGSADMTPPPTDENGVPVAITNITFEGTDSADAAKENVCEVDTQSGHATALESAMAEDVCKITFTVTAVGYADKEVVVSLPLVSKELVFDAPPRLSYGDENLQIGVDTPLPATTNLPVPADNSVDVTWSYLVEGNCEVNDSDGSLTLGEEAAAKDTCTVRAVASAEGFVDYIVEPVEVTVEPGELSFVTAGKPIYTGTLHTGGSLAPTLPNPSEDDNNIELTWEAWRGDGKCPVDEATGVVSAGGVGDECTIFVTATAPNYEPQDFQVGSLTVATAGDLGAITAPTYNGKLTIRGYPITIGEEPTAANGSNISWSYSAVAKRNSNVHEATEEICAVDPQSGVVTVGREAAIGDVCEITVTASAAGYAKAGTDDPVPLPVHDTFASMDWPTFLDGGGVGDTIDLSGSNGPVSVPEADDYAVTVASGNCTYNSTADTLVLADTGSCVLSVTATKENYIDRKATFSVTADLGSITVADWGNVQYHQSGSRHQCPCPSVPPRRGV